MKRLLATTAVVLCLGLPGVVFAEDVVLMKELVPREGANPQTKADQFKKAPPYKIGFSIWGFGNTWEIQMTHEAEYEASKHPEIGKFIFTNADSKPAKQVSDIEDLISQGVDALIVAPISLTAVSPVIDKAVARGIPVIVHSTAVDTDKYTVDIQGDPIHFGEVGGKFLAETLKGKGNIWVLRGQAGISEDQYRYDGLLAGLKGSDIKIVSEQYGDWSYDKGKQICESMLLSNPQVDGIWSSGGDMSRACIEVFGDMSAKVPPITGEGNNGFMKAWKASDAQAIAAVFSPEQGPAAVRAALALLEGKPLYHRYVARPAPITQADRDSYIRPDLSDNYWVPSSLPEAKKQEYFGKK